MENFWVNKDYRLVDKGDDLGRALGRFRGETRTMPIVADGKRPYGIVDGRKILRSGVRRTTKIDKVAQPTPCLTADADAQEVISTLNKALAPYVPVCSDDGSRCIGYVTAEDALDALDARLDADRATAYAPALAPSATIGEAVQLFAQHNIERLPVVDETGYVSGVLLRADLVRMGERDNADDGRDTLAGERQNIRDEPVEGIMEGGWTEIRADAGYEAIRAIVQQEGYTILTDDGKYAGTLDALRLIRAINAEAKEEVLYGTATPHYRRT